LWMHWHFLTYYLILFRFVDGRGLKRVKKQWPPAIYVFSWKSAISLEIDCGVVKQTHNERMAQWPKF
jgi:hypothetical protein